MSTSKGTSTRTRPTPKKAASPKPTHPTLPEIPALAAPVPELAPTGLSRHAERLAGAAESLHKVTRWDQRGGLELRLGEGGGTAGTFAWADVRAIFERW